ncbi:early protein (E6) [Prochlorococcus sp. MIT 1300]|uniref:early protein (E6) n=1 Tax=Prochlorococcus sp. MIT 1300 TaxID=3096218 RepID=UPI002A75606F|nr:early protein (E6) [Prochlorococcus sp. MIT 1300]
MDKRTKAGNAYWWCQCICGNTREVPSDSLSTKARKKKNITECIQWAHNSATTALINKGKQEELIRRKEAKEKRRKLLKEVPPAWLKLPLTDAHARELGQKHFFRGNTCKKGHLSPYRINGGCLKCQKKKKSTAN